MAKSSSRAAATERAAQMRAQSERKEKQRKNLIAAVVGVVVIIIAVSVGAVIANRPADKPAAGATAGVTALTKLTSIPAATFDAAAAPTPQQVPAKVDAKPVKADGKPEVLYVGAEFCPFCAIERWALIGSLSRFGTFEGLTQTTSSSSDALPDTPTYSFLKSKYTSDHVAFKAVETADREGNPLQTLEAADRELFMKNNAKGNIPVINYGGTRASAGATVAAQAFDGKTYEQIITGILDPNSELGKSVLPAANVMTAQICADTGGKPANVCTSAGVQAASVLLKK